ncbi:MAG TPA: 16S rRNA (cytosine(967)-C(5))-methyltransferase RsmB [Solirubrobacteraceae bacterium]|jgi:16S rRNA (cytosine967-C5)-methyltransferase|nr:16S rRNA (cytosine(967)-C(5))-methyltransferase RsmB [Solirubrobacteraceae bacterium]
MGPVPSKPSTAIAPARRCAYAVLRRVFEQGAYADLALQAEAGTLDHRDRALAMRLAYGAVQRKATLDHLIAALAERPADRLDAALLAAVRLGLYELLYLSGAPDRAVVGDAVELAKRNARGGHGLVNAVLRRAAREGSDALLGSLSDETPAAAAVMHSHPEWIVRLWWEELGAAGTRALLACDNEPGELALRANTLVGDADALARQLLAAFVPTHRDAQIPEALVLDGPFDAHGSPLWGTGAFVAQSRAAMLVSRALAPQPGERVLDLCAAPGGKTTHLAALMGGEGTVLAVERNQTRASRLQQTAKRLRASNVRVELGDAASPRPEGAAFDRVLVDPPCSGLGTLQARADLRWRVSPRAAAEMSAVQRTILAAGAEALRPGGVLVYSTCTISPTENEHVIANFLDSHADFRLDDLVSELPASTPEETGRGLAGTLMTLPHRDRTAGFFIARLRKA